MTVQALPVAAQAPTRAEPGHERVPSLRLHAERHVVADGAAIAIREDEKEDDRRHGDAQHEEGDQNDGEYHGPHIQESGFAATVHKAGVARTVPFRAARADAR